MDNVAPVLNCLCLRRAAEDDCDCTTTPNLQANGSTKVGAGYGAILLNSITPV